VAFQPASLRQRARYHFQAFAAASAYCSNPGTCCCLCCKATDSAISTAPPPYTSRPSLHAAARPDTIVDGAFQIGQNGRSNWRSTQWWPIYSSLPLVKTVTMRPISSRLTPSQKPISSGVGAPSLTNAVALTVRSTNAAFPNLLLTFDRLWLTADEDHANSRAP
jgi:hypothetical protein